jgi:hypothetical protein
MTERQRFDPRQRLKDFSSNLCVQTGSGAHPASCTMGTEGSFPGGKERQGRDADHSPHLVPRSRMSRSYTPLHPSSFVVCRGTASALVFLLPLLMIYISPFVLFVCFPYSFNSSLCDSSLYQLLYFFSSSSFPFPFVPLQRRWWQLCFYESF